MTITVQDKLGHISTEPLVPAPPETLLKIEKQLPSLSNEYRDFLRLCGGETVFPEVAIFQPTGYGEVDIEAFFSADEVIENARRYTEVVRENLVPIATSSGGDLLCLSANGTVFFWDHETNSRVQVGGSFLEFFLALRERSNVPDVSLDDVVVELDPDLLK